MKKRLVRRDISLFLKSKARAIIKRWSVSIFTIPGYQRNRDIVPRKVHASGMAEFLKAFTADIRKPNLKSCEHLINRLVFRDYLSLSSAADAIQSTVLLRGIISTMVSEKYAAEPAYIKIANDIITGQIDKCIVTFSNQYKKRDFNRLKTIIKYGRKLITVHNQDKLCDLILEAAVIESNPDRASLMLLGKDKCLHIKSSVGIPKRIAASTKVRFGHAIAGRVAKSAKPIVINEGDKIPACTRKLLRGLGLKSALSIPLMSDGTVLGVLNLSKRHSKPFFDKEDFELLRILANEAGTAIRNCRLFDEVHALYEGSIVSLAAAIDARDHYTLGHSERVSKIAIGLARALKLPSDAVEKTKLSSMLHDIGKIGVPDEILLKPGKLTKKEWRVIKKHPVYAVTILKHLPRLKHIVPIVYHEHERYDGKGYVKGLKGKQIPIESRIIAVADAYEAMTSNRPYRKAMRKKDAIKEIRKHRGTQFDPCVVTVFLKIMDKRN